MVKRYDLINQLIEKNNYVNYLEIGVRDPNDNFRKIKAAHKDGVDPANIRGTTDINYPVTSDEFFELIKDQDIKYDIIFIDGLHLWEQVDKDITNSLNHLQPNGTIVLHDCNPIKEEHQIREYKPGAHWNGDVWKAILKHRVENASIKLTVVNTDEGLGVMTFGKEKKYTNPVLDSFKTYGDVPYSFLNENRNDILNLVSVEDWEV